jgi:hypothetical protein
MNKKGEPNLINTYRIEERMTRVELHEHAVNMATAAYAHFGRMLPIWMIATYSDDRGDPELNGHFLLVIETAWENPDQKYRATEFMRGAVNDPDFGAYAYAFICEAWVASEKEGSKYDALRKQGRGVPPGERPEDERDDILMILSFERDGDSAMTRFLTHDRGGPGRNFLGPRTEMPETIEGVMCLFPKKEEKKR